MKLTAKEIAQLTGGELSGNPETTVTGVAPLKEASPSDISFVSHPKYAKELGQSKAGIVFLIKGTNPDGRTAVLVDNPQAAFAKILDQVAREKDPLTPGIHPSAIVDRSAKIGANVSIGAGTVVDKNAEIGDDSHIGALCYIGSRVRMGKNCRIHPHVTIREEIIVHDRVIIHSGTVVGSDGFGYVTVDKVHHKIAQVGTVEIEDDVELGANVTVDRATMGKTVIGRGSKIDNLVQIAHNVKIGPGCIIVSQAGIAGSSQLGSFVTLAGQVGVVGHINIGDGVIAAAQSGIPNDVPAGTIVFGSPARPIQEERKIQVIVGKLPKIYDEFRKMKKIVFKENTSANE